MCARTGYASVSMVGADNFGCDYLDHTKRMRWIDNLVDSSVDTFSNEETVPQFQNMWLSVLPPVKIGIAA